MISSAAPAVDVRVSTRLPPDSTKRSSWACEPRRSRPRTSSCRGRARDRTAAVAESPVAHAPTLDSPPPAPGAPYDGLTSQDEPVLRPAHLEPGTPQRARLHPRGVGRRRRSELARRDGGDDVGRGPARQQHRSRGHRLHVPAGGVGPRDRREGTIRTHPWAGPDQRQPGGTRNHVDLEWQESVPTDVALDLGDLEALAPEFGWRQVYASGRQLPAARGRRSPREWEEHLRRSLPGSSRVRRSCSGGAGCSWDPASSSRPRAA